MDATRHLQRDFALISAVCAALVVIYFVTWGWSNVYSELIGKGPTLWFASWFLIGSVIHEVIHAVFFTRSPGIRVSDLEFGFDWKYLAPFVGSRKPISIVWFRRSAIAPLLILGVLPLIIAFVSGATHVFVLAIFLTQGSSTDFTLWRLTRELPGHLDVQFSDDGILHILSNDSSAVGTG